MTLDKKIGGQMTLGLKNFSRKELECPCCKVLGIQEEAGRKLETLRENLGFPLKISSGFRCEKHNRALGGARESRHLLGLAFDIGTSRMTAKEKFLLLQEGTTIFQGVGVYNKHVHLDIREEKALWTGESR